MKHAAYGLVAAFLATGVYGAIPTTAEGWYEPEGGFTAQSGTGTIYYGYDRATGQWQTTTVTVDEQGNIEGGDIDFGRDYDLMTAYQALTKALYNEAYNAVQDEAIQTIGKNLHALTSKDGIHIRNENTGQEFTIKFGGSIASAVSGSTGDIPATSDAEDPTDKKSIDWTDNGKLELKGWAAQDVSGSFWDSSPGPVGVPVRTGYGGAAMAYRNWYGVDGLSLAPESSTHKLELNGWYDAPATMTPLAEAITKEHKGTFDSYDLVVRNSSKGLNYVSLGTLDIGGARVDGSSITTNAADGAESDGAASLYGWSGANVYASSTNPNIPYADGSGQLAWQGVLDFFNTGLFDLTESGKVNLKGVTAGEDDLRVMTVSASDSGAAITSSSISTMIDAPLDMDSNKITVDGWGDATPSAASTLAESLTSGTGYVNDPSRSTSLLARTSSGGVSYMAIGSLSSAPGPDGKSVVTNGGEVAVNGYAEADIGAVAYKTADGLEWRVPEDITLVDGSSITTNAEDGASSSGVASLYGWADAAAEDFPRKGSGGHLEWTSPGDLVDGSSIAWAEVDGGKKFEVRDAHVYAGQHSRHYFGTSNDKTASLGWHELPNVTTNRVEGDNITIASMVDEQEPGLKLLGLKGWNKGWGGDPLFVVNAGGSVGYIPLPALTNLAACACTQKWENVTEWIGGGAEVDDGGGLALPNDSLDEYLYDTLGYVYSTTPDNLHFDNDGEGVEASFGAPVNWADGESVEAVDGTYQVKGWADASACAASVSTMLSSPGGSDATTHLFLAKKTDTGALHYVSIGNGVKSGAEVDDTTITTNASHGAVSSGSASIYGWSSAANDTYLSKNASGNLEWRQVAGGGAPVDDVSITTNTTHGAVTSGVAGLFGFADAPLGTVPIAVSDGGTKKLGWGTTGNFGITATKNGANWIYTVDGGYFTRARTQTYVSGITVSTSGYVYLKVPLGTGSSASIVLESATKTSDSSYTYILLYYCNVSMGVADYRGAPHIQVWE